MKPGLLIGALAATAAGAYAAISIYGADRITRRAHKRCDVEPLSVAPVFEDVQLRSRDGLLLEGWWFPVEDADRAAVLIHGHGQNRIDVNWGADAIARALLERGFSVLVFDLRGHGASPRSRQSFGVRERHDVLGALDFVRSRGFAASRTAFIGISYGAASLLLAAPEMPEAGALVADSAYASIWPVISAEIPRQSALLSRLRPGPGIRVASRVLHRVNLSHAAPIAVVGRIDHPLLFVHGDADAYIPIWHSERLVGAAGNRTSTLWRVPGAGHGETYSTAPAAYVERVTAFLDERIPPEGA